jgi:hypothetical protein
MADRHQVNMAPTAIRKRPYRSVSELAGPIAGSAARAIPPNRAGAAIRYSLAFLCLSAGSFAADYSHWGEPVAGLRMALSLDGTSPTGERALRIAIENQGNRDQLLCIGTIIGGRAYLDKLTPVFESLSGPERKQLRLRDREMPGAVGGRIDPLVIALPAGASYSTVLPMQRLVSLEATARSLESLATVRSELWVELDVSAGACPLYGAPNPNMIDCWHGKLVSAPLSFGDEWARAGDNDQTRWIAEVLRSIETIKVGMTRQELRRVFTSEGGISFVGWRRYIHRECAYIKVDVEFAPTHEGQREQLPTDRITKISRPFLEWSILD